MASNAANKAEKERIAALEAKWDASQKAKNNAVAAAVEKSRMEQQQMMANRRAMEYARRGGPSMNMRGVSPNVQRGIRANANRSRGANGGVGGRGGRGGYGAYGGKRQALKSRKANRKSKKSTRKSRRL